MTTEDTTTEDTTAERTAPIDEAATSRPTILQRIARRFINAEETAALLEVTEEVLRRWRASGIGPQPVLTPNGRLYASDQIEHLATLPRPKRLLAISRSTCRYIPPRS